MGSTAAPNQEWQMLLQGFVTVVFVIVLVIILITIIFVVAVVIVIIVLCPFLVLYW
jgi:hypothetical protein